MKCVFHTLCSSPHQLPLACELVRLLGEDNYRYVAVSPMQNERRQMGWGGGRDMRWIVRQWEDKEKANALIRSAEIFITGERDLSLMEFHLNQHHPVIYCSERWFKPRLGICRLMLPAYFKMAYNFVKLLTRRNSTLYYYPMGVHAARDMARLCGLMHGDWRCLFKAPELVFQKEPGGKICLQGKNIKNSGRYCLDKMRLWGYFVENSELNRKESIELRKMTRKAGSIIRVLWVGRLLDWKRVDTIIKAVGEHSKMRERFGSLPEITLDIYGTGPKRERLKRMAAKYNCDIRFYSPVPIPEVRALMRQHDVYVLASNSYEGWGAVVNEALEEGMDVLGTFEAGASATLLPRENLFHSGDWRGLRALLASRISGANIGAWTPRNAADVFYQSFFTRKDSGV